MNIITVTSRFWPACCSGAHIQLQWAGLVTTVQQSCWPKYETRTEYFAGSREDATQLEILRAARLLGTPDHEGWPCGMSCQTRFGGHSCYPSCASYRAERQQTGASVHSSLGCRSPINVCKHGHQAHSSGGAGRLTNASSIRPYPGIKTESFDMYLGVAPSTEQAKYPVLSVMVNLFFLWVCFQKRWNTL